MKISIVFDNKFLEEFDGSQEEFDELVASIQKEVMELVDSGELDVSAGDMTLEEFVEEFGDHRTEKRTLH